MTTLAAVVRGVWRRLGRVVPALGDAFVALVERIEWAIRGAR